MSVGEKPTITGRPRLRIGMKMTTIRALFVQDAATSRRIMTDSAFYRANSAGTARIRQRH
jgi:hypothetical protein